jgi:hypothetical protein
MILYNLKIVFCYKNLSDVDIKMLIIEFIIKIFVKSVMEEYFNIF